MDRRSRLRNRSKKDKVRPSDEDEPLAPTLPKLNVQQVVT